MLSALVLLVVLVSLALGLGIYPRLAREASSVDPNASSLGALAATGLLAVAFSISGHLILRNTSNRVGWLLHGTGLCFAFTWIGLAFSALDAVGRDIGVAGRLAASWFGFGWYPAVTLMGILLPLLFPTGRLPTPKWVWVEVLAAAALVFGFGAVTIETLRGGPLNALMGASPSWLVLTVLAAVGVAGSGASVLVRYRRAARVERLQIKWVAATFVLLCVTIGLSLSPLNRGLLGPPIGAIIGFSVFGLVPISIVLAISRRHLYDIDRLISRTLSYALVIGALLMVYIGAFGLLTRFLPMESDLAVAASTLATASLFNPLRRRIQKWVDRRFNRTRYVAAKELDSFIERVNDTAELAAVEIDLTSLVNRTLEPAGMSLWIRKVVG